MNSLRVALSFVLLGLVFVAPLRADEDTEPEAGSDSSFLRLELWARGGTPIDARVKLGREGSARGWRLRRDARRDATPSYGYGLELDLEVLDWASVGLSGYEVVQTCSRRRIHYEGIDLDGRVFAGDTRLTPRLELRFGEVSIRYVWRNDPHLRLWFGIGAAWASTRITLRGAGQRASTRWQDVFAPSLSYALWARLGERWEVFLLSGIAFAPHRFPSLISRFRLGLGRELIPGVSLRVAGGIRNGLLGDSREQLSKRARTGHDWRRIRWSSFGVEVGISFRI